MSIMKYEKGDRVRVSGFHDAGTIVDVKIAAGQVVVHFDNDTYEQVSIYYLEPVNRSTNEKVTTSKEDLHDLLIYLCKPEHLKEMFCMNPFFKHCNYDRLAVRLTMILSTVWAYFNKGEELM